MTAIEADGVFSRGEIQVGLSRASRFGPSTWGLPRGGAGHNVAWFNLTTEG